MAPLKPHQFAPKIISFDNEDQVLEHLESGDGIFQEADLETAEIYVNNVKLNYEEPAVNISYQGSDYWLAYESFSDGQVRFHSFEDESAETKKAITADLPITKIIFEGVTYEP